MLGPIESVPGSGGVTGAISQQPIGRAAPAGRWGPQIRAPRSAARRPPGDGAKKAFASVFSQEATKSAAGPSVWCWPDAGRVGCLLRSGTPRPGRLDAFLKRAELVSVKGTQWKFSSALRKYREYSSRVAILAVPQLLRRVATLKCRGC